MPFGVDNDKRGKLYTLLKFIDSINWINNALWVVWHLPHKIQFGMYIE